MSRTHTHNGYRYASQRKRFKSICEDRGDVCWLCLNPIDYSLEYPDPMSFTVDHVVPTSKSGDPYALDNMAPAHLRCNSKRKDRKACRGMFSKKKRGYLATSRDWLEGCIPSP